MAQAMSNDAPEGLSNNFNHNSKSDWIHGLHWGHVGLMVLGMTFPMVASAAPLGGTALDIVVQFGHGIVEMFSNSIEHTMPVLESVWDNAIDGNFMPSTWDAGSMHGMEHAAGHTAEHIATHGGDALNTQFDNLMRDLHNSGSLEQAIDDSEALGITIEEHLMNEYGHDGH